MSNPESRIDTTSDATGRNAMHADAHPAVALHVAERLILRRPGPDDFVRFAAIHADPATNAFNPAGPTEDVRIAEAAFAAWLQHWSFHGFGVWAVATVAQPGEVIGFGGVAMRDYGGVPRWNLGYRFAASAWGNGYATELAVVALRMAFHTLGLDQVHALVRPLHAASIRVLEKTGMERDGELDDVPGQAPSLVYSARAAR
jgi:RimJ/RimL family protein N-acetyltransferase